MRDDGLLAWQGTRSRLQLHAWCKPVCRGIVARSSSPRSTWSRATYIVIVAVVLEAGREVVRASGAVSSLYFMGW